MNLTKLKKLKKIYPVVIGAVLGYSYYYFIGCYSGTCPIQGNPYLSTLYGAAIGATFLLPSRKKKKKEENE